MVKSRAGDSSALSGDTRVQDVALTFVSAVLAVAAAGAPLLWEPRFFYTDDYQTYFMPLFHEVARLLETGEFPFITDRIWSGGAILAEYQLAVFNPVSLALYLLITNIGPAPAAAAVYSLFHIAVFAAGIYFMCRALQCKPSLSMMAAVTASTSGWLLYWGAGNWIPALVSLAWMPWAVGSLLRLHEGSQWFLPAAFSVALVLVSGWPFAVLAFTTVVAVVWLMTVSWQMKGNIRRCVPIYLALLAGGLLAAPAVLPMVPYLLYSERLVDAAPIWQSSLAALLAVGLPFDSTVWNTFYGREVVALPMTYVAWFIPVVLANASLKRILKTPEEAALLAVVLCLACLSMLPQLGHFRWMFRLLPYYQVALIVLTALVLSRRGETISFRMLPTALALLVPLAVSLLTLPGMTVVYAGSTVLVLLLIIATTFLARVRRGTWAGLALLSNVLVVWAVSYRFVSAGFPSYPTKFLSPFSNREEAASAVPSRRIALFSRAGLAGAEADWRDFRPGNSSLFDNVISINGYSAFLPKPFREQFCFDYLGGLTCDDIIDRLTLPVEGLGSSLLDLTRTEVVDIQSPQMAEQFSRVAAGGWRSSIKPSGATVFSRQIDAAGPADPVSWQSPGVQTEVLSQSPRRIIVDVANDAVTEATLVLARAWYPDWHARLNGVDLPVEAVRGLLVQVRLPGQTRGQVIIEYWPAGLAMGFWMAAAGGILALGGLAWSLRMRGRPCAVPANREA